MRKPLPVPCTHAELLQTFSLVDDALVWKNSRGRVKAGTRAGHHSKRGHWLITLNKNPYHERRLIVYYRTGVWSDDDDNLYQTNKSGHRHISFVKRSNRWEVQIYGGGKHVHHSVHKSLDEAIAARDAALIKPASE
jgi:hypothetical protein